MSQQQQLQQPFMMFPYNGQIKDFPREVVEKMLEYQVAQGNNRDVSIFERNKRASFTDGGFAWSETDGGMKFWEEVIGNKDFFLFFERYGKKGDKTIKKTIIGYYLKETFLGYYKLLEAALGKINFTSSEQEAALYITKCKTLGIADWFYPKYSDQKTIIKMDSLDGKFELEVSEEGIFYRPDGMFLNIQELKQIVNDSSLNCSKKKVDGEHTSSKYVVIYKTVDVGCKKDTKISQWKTVLKTYSEIYKK